ncbi:MAG: hypothetical protein RSG23_10000, partial [Gordonibacter sp.]
VSEAQMDTLEFHVWGSRINSLEKPDSMVFDLDPDEGLGLDAVRLEWIFKVEQTLKEEDATER